MPTVPESCGKPEPGEGRGTVRTLPRARSWRKEWVEANLACERKKKCSPRLRSGFPGTLIWPASRNLGIVNCRNVTCSFADHPLPPGIEKKGHTHPYMVIKSQGCRCQAEGKTG